MPESLNAAAGHVGLHNEREFYSDHYLAELLGSDLRPVVARWRAAAAAGEERSDAPDVQLGALAGEHRRIREAFRRAGDDGQAVRIQRRWFRLQLEALGHRWAPAAYPLETGEEIPVLGEAEGVGGRLLALGAYAPDADGDDPPLPAAQAGPGLLVRAVVLADRGEGRSAEPGGVPDRGEHRPDGRRAGRGRAEAPAAAGVRAGDAAGMARRILDETGLLDLERLCELFPRLGFVDELAKRMRFLHWDLAFADVLYGTGPDGEPSTGFDLVLGNPPWIKLSWDEAGVIGDFEPSVVVRRRRAAALRRERPGLLARSPGLRAAYLDEYAATEATKAYLGAPQNYTLLQGVQANSYKCFLPQAWSVLGERGVAGLLHPEGVFDDPRGGALRAAVYARLRAHFQFQNETQALCGRGSPQPGSA